MVSKTTIKLLVFLFSVSLFLGCDPKVREFEEFGRDVTGQPMEYRYLSSAVVEVKVRDKVYQLDMDGPRVRTPFRYQFEDDGDLDIVIGGRAYDIDSPYDIDIKVKKKKPKQTTKKKVSKKKKTTKKKTKKKSSSKKKN